jgi:hypothetical protein
VSEKESWDLALLDTVVTDSEIESIERDNIH